MKFQPKKGFEKTTFLKFEHYDLAISEVFRYGFLRGYSFFNKLTKRSCGWIQEKNSKNKMNSLI
jgi:hypothetical protein